MEDFIEWFILTVLILAGLYAVYINASTVHIVKANDSDINEEDNKIESLVDKYMLDLDLFMKEGNDINITNETELREFVLLLIYFNLNGSYIIINKFEYDEMLSALSLYYGFHKDMISFIIKEVYTYSNEFVADRSMVKLGKALKKSNEDGFKDMLFEFIDTLRDIRKDMVLTKI